VVAALVSLTRILPCSGPAIASLARARPRPSIRPNASRAQLEIVNALGDFV
jgi:hypothetical protein